ncbi:hypothetical protein [Methylomarinum vadi]|uniref:hypothetical protein n=1 Tax=Methylomarinum vadi TaxID=438855 RepID=UPI0004DF7516|nr:hypothetical protein [Methylomarinum vadi]
MNEDKKTPWNMDNALRYIYINEIIFIALIFVCFLGELLAEVTERVAFFYWLLVTPFFYYCSYLSEKAKAISTGVENAQLIRYQLYYWGSAFIAVVLVFLMWHADMIKAGGAAMSIHIILAHTMFLSGIVLGLHYYLIGAILFLTAALNILVSGTFGLDLMLAIPLIWLGFYLEDTVIFPTLKRKNDFVRELESERRNVNKP